MALLERDQLHCSYLPGAAPQF